VSRRNYPVESDMFAAGFYRLHMADHRSTFCRWNRGHIREEIALCFDSAGRLVAWSVWHNERVKPPDHEVGKRQRLLEWAAPRTEPEAKRGEA